MRREAAPVALRAGLTALVALVALRALPVRAAIEGTPHDLIAQGYDVVESSAQEERCTVCHVPASRGLKGFIPAVPPVLAVAYDASSVGCFSCHDGTTIVSPDVDASRSAFHPRSHGNDLTGYEGLETEAVGLPHLAGERMECVTCHDPHDNRHRPFLRVEFVDLCLACHAKLAEYGQGDVNRTGNHELVADPLRAPREEAPVRIDEAFRTPFPGGYPTAQGKAAGPWHWDLGGHLGGGGAGGIVCGTCHAVHGGRTAPPNQGLLTVAPENDTANLFCEGCHAGTRGDGRRAPPNPNPGGTTTARTYHPVDDDVANGEGRLLETREPPAWPFGGGSPRRLLCTSCHVAHGAWVETPLLRAPENPAGFCEECHPAELVPSYHHPVGELEEKGCAVRLPRQPFVVGRGLSCSGCHRAHNAGRGAEREADYVPLLREPLRDGGLCAACHPPENPTCNADEAHRASHYLGDPLEDYGDSEPPLRRVVWPESGLPSRFGDPEDRVVTCLSCHVFRTGAVVSGDDGKRGHLLARSGNPVEWPEGGESVYLCTGCHSVDPKTGGTKGHSHPMMNADAEKLNRAVVLPSTVTPAGRVNCDSCHRPHGAVTKGGRYILEQVDGTNADPEAIHPKIDFTSSCHLCHDPGKY